MIRLNRDFLNYFFLLISLIFEDTEHLSSDLLMVGYSQHR